MLPNPIAGQPLCSKENDAFDLLAVFSYLRRARLWLAAGGFVGFLTGSWLVFSSMQFISRVIVTTDQKSLPAISDPDQILTRYNAALTSPQFSLEVFRKVLSSDEINNSLKKKGVDITDLAAIQSGLIRKNASPSLGVGPGQNAGTEADFNDVICFLRKRLSSTDFIFEIRLPVNGLGSNARQILVEALNHAGSLANSDTRTRKLDVDEARRLASTNMIKNNTEIVSNLTLETEKARIEALRSLAQIEYEIISRHPQKMETISRNLFSLLPATRELVAADTTNVSINTGVRPFADGVARLVGLAQKANLISEKEVRRFQEEIASITAEQVKFELTNSMHSSMISHILTNVRNESGRWGLPIDPEKEILPLFKLNELPDLMGKFSGNRIEVPRVRVVTIVASTLAGAILFGFFSLIPLKVWPLRLQR